MTEQRCETVVRRVATIAACGKGRSVRAVIGEILPLALVVTISPLNIIPAILLLFTRKPLVNATAFLVGFTLGVGALLGLFVVLAGTVDLSPGGDHARWTGGLKLILGTYLLAAAIRKFRGRPRGGEQGSMPSWMDGIAGYGAGRALSTGAALGAGNPKNVVVGLAAAATIASSGLAGGQQFVVIAVYVVIAVLGVAAPIAVALCLGNRAAEVLQGWNIWLKQNNATVMSVLFLVFGVVLIGQGVAGI